MQSSQSRMDIYRLFDRIAPRCDAFNRVSSLGLDTVWRRRLARLLKGQNSLRVLDIATGTGDLLLSLFNAGCPIFSAVGLDLSPRMLEIAGKKLTHRNLAPKVVLKQADAFSLPFPDASFDVVTCVYRHTHLLIYQPHYRYPHSLKALISIDIYVP